MYRALTYAGAMGRTVKVATVFLATFGAGLLGLFFMDSKATLWYAQLVKPPFTPPNIVFPIAWTILYTLMALAACIAWLKEQSPETEGWLRFYFVQLLFNAAWTIFFFGFQAIPLAFTDGLVLSYLVFGLVISGWEVRRSIFYLLLPYLLWTIFALYLTLGVWILN